MFAAAEVVAVLREPAIEFFGERTHEGNRKDPRDQLSFGQHVEESLDRRGALPCLAGRVVDDLHRLEVCASGNPGKARVETWSLGRKYLELAVFVPLGKYRDELFANFAEPVVNNSIRTSGRPDSGRVIGYILPFDSKADDRNCRHVEAPAATAGAAVSTLVLIVGECDNVACTAQRVVTRFAAACRAAGSEGHETFMSISPTRCGSSANFHATSTTISVESSFALLAHDASTEYVQNARELASI
jgi:hypothetical protein